MGEIEKRIRPESKLKIKASKDALSFGNPGYREKCIKKSYEEKRRKRAEAYANLKAIENDPRFEE